MTAAAAAPHRSSCSCACAVLVLTVAVVTAGDNGRGQLGVQGGANVLHPQAIQVGARQMLRRWHNCCFKAAAQ